MPIHENPDFIQAVGEELSDAVCPPVPFEDASAHECYEALSKALGNEITPVLLKSLSSAQLESVGCALSEYFECGAISVDKVKHAIAGILARWPILP